MSSMAAGISLTGDDGVVLEVRDMISYLLTKVDRDTWRRVVADWMVAQRYGVTKWWLRSRPQGALVLSIACYLTLLWR